MTRPLCVLAFAFVVCICMDQLAFSQTEIGYIERISGPVYWKRTAGDTEVVFNSKDKTKHKLIQGERFRCGPRGKLVLVIYGRRITLTEKMGWYPIPFAVPILNDSKSRTEKKKGLTGGRTSRVRYNFLRDTDFAKYKTYKWVRIPNVQYPDDLLDRQIIQAIDFELALKGLTKTEGGAADLLVTYQAANNGEKQWNSYSTGGDYWGWGGWGGWGGMSSTTTTSQTINIGTLNVDIYDLAKKQQIWRGEATRTLTSDKDSRKVQMNINKAMEKLFENYPPPVKE